MRDPLSVDEVIERVRRRFRDAPVPGLVSVYLFGSYARDAAHRESDVDIAVFLDRATHSDAAARFDVRVRLAAELEAAVGREVDVVALNDAPPLLARRIIEEGRRLLCTDADADRAFARQTRIRAGDRHLDHLRRIRRRVTGADALREDLSLRNDVLHSLQTDPIDAFLRIASDVAGEDLEDR